MADIDTAPKHDTEVNDANPVDQMVKFFEDNSQVKSNGIREVSKAGFDSALMAVGVSAQDVKRVNEAVNHATAAAAMVAATDLEQKINGASADDLANDDHRRSLSSIVRLPTLGGKTEVQVYAEKVDNIPFRGGAEGGEKPQSKTTYGRVRVSINANGRLPKDLPGSVSDRMRSALGVEA